MNKRVKGSLLVVWFGILQNMRFIVVVGWEKSSAKTVLLMWQRQSEVVMADNKSKYSGITRSGDSEDVLPDQRFCRVPKEQGGWARELPLSSEKPYA